MPLGRVVMFALSFSCISHTHKPLAQVFSFFHRNYHISACMGSWSTKPTAAAGRSAENTTGELDRVERAAEGFCVPQSCVR